MRALPHEAEDPTQAAAALAEARVDPRAVGAHVSTHGNRKSGPVEYSCIFGRRPGVRCGARGCQIPYSSGEFCHVQAMGRELAREMRIKDTRRRQGA